MRNNKSGTERERERKETGKEDDGKEKDWR